MIKRFINKLKTYQKNQLKTYQKNHPVIYNIGFIGSSVTAGLVITVGVLYSILVSKTGTFDISKQQEIFDRRAIKREVDKKRGLELESLIYKYAFGDDKIATFEEQVDLARELGYNGYIYEGDNIRLDFGFYPYSKDGFKLKHYGLSNKTFRTSFDEWMHGTILKKEILIPEEKVLDYLKHKGYQKPF